MADDVARGVGKVMQIVEGDPLKVIFVFDEDHRSRLGQVEIAVMLDRLYSQYRVRHFGLEGHTADKPPLNLAWAHRKPYFQPGQKITPREDVIAYTLRAGEISSTEFIGLIYADVVIHGIDDAKLYAVQLTSQAEGALGNYLFQLAYARMNLQQRAAWQTLYEQKKYSEAFNYAVNTDPFTARVWGRYTDWRDPLPAEQGLELLGQIEQEMQKAGLRPPPDQQAAFNTYREYVKVISARSDAMVANMLNVAAAKPGAPLALTGLGIDHTKRVMELLTQAGVSIVHIRPAALTEEKLVTVGWLSNEAYARKGQGRSVAPAGHLGALLEGRKKPPPVANQKEYQRQMYLKQVGLWILNEANRRWRQGYAGTEIRDQLNQIIGVDDISGGGGFGYSDTRLSDYGIERAEITNVETVRIGDRDTVKIGFNVSFTDPSSWAGAGVRMEGTIWFNNPLTTESSLSQHLIEMRDSITNETVPLSATQDKAPVFMVQPEQISSTGSATWRIVQ